MELSVTLAKYNHLRRQKGLTTLAITLLLLIILTLIVLFSTNVAYFEQRTTTNENRARLVEQAAEYAINIAGEYMKANRNVLISDTPVTGWLSADAPRWVRCSSIGNADADFTAGHPCLSERDNITSDGDYNRRATLYFYSLNGSQTVPYRAAIAGQSAALELETTGVGGLMSNNTAFTTTTNVKALLCRLDTSLTTPICAVEPIAGNRVLVTLIADATLPNENASAQLKQTWATYSAASPSAAVPLVASGLIKGVGNAQIVVSPNAGGYGIPASMWSPCPIDIDDNTVVTIPNCATPAPGASVGSVSTCQVGEYLKTTPENQLLTTCATSNNACGCPSINTAGSDFLSGHSGSVKKENYDIIDRDGNNGVLPDITFFPDAKYGIDNVADTTDDSLFEWIFGIDYEADHNTVGGISPGNSLMNCPHTNIPTHKPNNCAVKALVDDFEATVIVNCNGLNAASTGIYYVTGNCTLPNQVGSPDNFAIVVANDEIKLNGTLMYGLLFVRSDTNTGVFKGVGNSKVFGSVVVQGEADIAGTLDLVYVDTSVTADTHKIPKSAKFALVPGSWLDNQSGL